MNPTPVPGIRAQFDRRDFELKGGVANATLGVLSCSARSVYVFRSSEVGSCLSIHKSPGHAVNYTWFANQENTSYVHLLKESEKCLSINHENVKMKNSRKPLGIVFLNQYFSLQFLCLLSLKPS